MFYNDSRDFTVPLEVVNGRSVFRLGYVRENWPYIAKCSLDGARLRPCLHPGIMSEAWLQFGDFYDYDLSIRQYQYYGDYNVSTRDYYGVLYGLVHDEVDATLSLLTPSNTRLKGMEFGPVMTTYQIGFVYGHSSLEQSIRISVFDWWTLGLVLFTYGVMLALALLRGHTLDEALTRLLAFATFRGGSWNPLLLLGYYFLYVLYSAGFRSQAISGSLATRPFRTLEHLGELLHSGEINVVIEDSTMLRSAQTLYPSSALYHSYPPVLVKDYKRIVDRLCRDRTAVYYGNVAPMGGIWYAKPPCALRILPLDHSSSIATFLVVGFRRTLPELVKVRIKAFLTTLYNANVFDSHWAKRYKNYYNIDPNGVAFSPIRIDSLLNAVYLYLEGMAVASFCLVGEVLLLKMARIVQFNLQERIVQARKQLPVLLRYYSFL